jgi:hypothetical protein
MQISRQGSAMTNARVRRVTSTSVFLCLVLVCFLAGTAQAQNAKNPQSSWPDPATAPDEEVPKIMASFQAMGCGIGFIKYAESHHIDTKRLGDYCKCVYDNYTGGMSRDRAVNYGKGVKEMEPFNKGKKLAPAQKAKFDALKAKWEPFFNKEHEAYRGSEKACQKKMGISLPYLDELGEGDDDESDNGDE